MKRRIRNLSLFTLFLLALVIGGGWFKLMHMQAMAFAHPARTIPEGMPSIDFETVSFQTEDRITLYGWFIPPEENHAVLLYVHGLGGNRGDFLPESERLHQSGYGALLFDLRNHGASGGTVTTMGAREVLDVQAAFDFLAERQIECIGIVGRSMGGATAIRAMRQIPEVRVLIIDSAYTSIADVLSDGIRSQIGIPGFPSAQIIVWMTGRATDANLFDVRPVDDIGAIAPRPILLMHGDADSTIPVWHARDLFAAANEPKWLVIVPDGGHGGMMLEDMRAVVDFLDANLDCGG
jgi:fermentation-respiration switch protein FrsA (DUF1100 family)